MFGSRPTDNRSLKDVKNSQRSSVPPEISDLHCFTETNGVLTTTMVDVPGYRVVRVLGAVYGLTVRSRNIAASISMVLKAMAGGELRWFTDLIYNARNDAVGRLVAETQSRGGNAIIALRFDVADLGGFASVGAYGTAAIIEKIEGSDVVLPQLEKH
ncbi:DUF74-domain-containing protein [Thozetella sp. PMI_491]|nr:DUF74-domain-containing protein [Thozetella sp. PMI_491]